MYTHTHTNTHTLYLCIFLSEIYLSQLFNTSGMQQVNNYLAFLLKKLSNVPCFFDLLLDDDDDDGSCCLEDKALLVTGDDFLGGVEVAGLFVTIYPLSLIHI